MRACITTTICKQTHALSQVWDSKESHRVSSPSQHQFVIIIARPTKAETNTHTHTHPTLYALTPIFTHVKHRPYTHPFVHSQGIFQWAKPGTGYTAAGTSAQCMSVKHPRFLSLSVFLLLLFLISQSFDKNGIVKLKEKKSGSSYPDMKNVALLVRDDYLFIM